MMPALLMRTSIAERFSRDFPALVTWESEERSSSRAWVSTFGLTALMSEMVSLTLERLRPARTRSLGEPVARERAMAAPSPPRDTPVMMT